MSPFPSSLLSCWDSDREHLHLLKPSSLDSSPLSCMLDNVLSYLCSIKPPLVRNHFKLNSPFKVFRLHRDTGKYRQQTARLAVATNSQGSFFSPSAQSTKVETESFSYGRGERRRKDKRGRCEVIISLRCLVFF